MQLPNIQQFTSTTVVKGNRFESAACFTHEGKPGFVVADHITNAVLYEMSSNISYVERQTQISNLGNVDKNQAYQVLLSNSVFYWRVSLNIGC